jgi:alkylation response protein AidB-like acyl-CoA dehydrogenase
VDFSYSPAQRALQEKGRAAVKEIVEPIAARVPPGQKLSLADLQELYGKLAPTGYVGSTIPKDSGGAGLSYLDYGLLLEALAAGPIILAEVVPPRSIHHLGSPEQRERWLPRLLSGEIVGTAAITEPQAGSDLRNLQTSAVPEGDQYRVEGRKRWIKFGGVANFITLLVVTDPKLGAKGGTTRLFIEREVSPWTHQEIDCVGMRNLSFAELAFDGVLVPKPNQLGGAGSATDAFLRAIEASRALVALQAAGIGRHALDLAARYVRERKAFGRTLAQFQAIQTVLAEAEAEIESARLLALKALWTLDQGQRCPREASLSKFQATEAAVRASRAAMDCMGAYGLAEDAGAERCWRDAQMLTVIDGAPGIQRLVAGREILGVAAFT